jgi:hypothetical protein
VLDGDARHREPPSRAGTAGGRSRTTAGDVAP